MARETRNRLRLRGLLAVAPLGEDPAEAFARLARIRTTFLEGHPDATVLSAVLTVQTALAPLDSLGRVDEGEKARMALKAWLQDLATDKAD